MNGPCTRPARCRLRMDWARRRGSVLVLAAALIIAILGMTAFAVDLGYICVTKTQMRSASDAAALAAAVELTDGLGIAPESSTAVVVSEANSAATTVAGLQRNGDQSSTLVDAARDVRFGQMNWDTGSNSWVKTYGVAPYNLVEVTVRRDQPRNSAAPSADSRLPLFFAPAIGCTESGLSVVADAALFPGVGITVSPGSSLTAGVLPITLDDETWTALLAGTGTDNYHYDPDSKTVTTGADGVLEVSLYPTGTGSPGNRGTVNIGTTNNSTSNLQRQILYGLNSSDLAPYGGVLRTDNGPLLLAGNPGISAAIKSSLTTIIGVPKLIPIFINLTGNGANAQYTISKFVGVRVMHVQLTGGNKTVVIQPATYSSRTVLPGKVPVSDDTYWTKPRLAQ